MNVDAFRELTDELFELAKEGQAVAAIREQAVGRLARGVGGDLGERVRSGEPASAPLSRMRARLQEMEEDLEPLVTNPQSFAGGVLYAMREVLGGFEAEAEAAREDIEERGVPLRHRIVEELARADEEGLRPRDLIRRLGAGKFQVSHELSRLQDLGLVEERERTALHDGRGRWYGLTNEGRREVA